MLAIDFHVLNQVFVNAAQVTTAVQDIGPAGIVGHFGQYLVPWQNQLTQVFGTDHGGGFESHII